MDRSERIRALDTLRGIAAVVVVVWHYRFYFKDKPFPRLFAPFYNNGQVAVDLFFVLSGFVLIHVYGDRLRDWKSMGDFVAHRVARLYPLHLLTLIVTASIVAIAAWTPQRPFLYAFNDQYHFALNLGLAQYIGLQYGWSYNGPSWSISTEFWTNILFGGCAIAVGSRRWALAVSMVLVASGLLLVGHEAWSAHKAREAYLDPSLLRTIAAFYTGVVVYRFRPRLSGTWPAIAVLVGLAAAFAAMLTPRASMWFVTSEVFFALVGAPLLVVGVATCSGMERACRSVPFVWLGEISYSVYLWHYPVACVFLLIGAMLWLDEVALFVSYFVVLGVVATLSFHYFETPTRKLVIRWTRPSLDEVRV